jgi:hypothetical protein
MLHTWQKNKPLYSRITFPTTSRNKQKKKSAFQHILPTIPALILVEFHQSSQNDPHDFLKDLSHQPR